MSKAGAVLLLIAVGGLIGLTTNALDLSTGARFAVSLGYGLAVGVGWIVWLVRA